MASRANMAIRHSIAPRVLDNSLPMRTLTSTARFSVRVEPRRDPAAGAAAADAPILATFVWKDAGARVQLAGSFDDWRKHDMTYVAGVAYFVLVVELPPGEYYYRFVVDGRWRVADGDANLREDPFGEQSHFLEINARALETTTPSRFSTAAVARVDLPRDSAGAPGGGPVDGDGDGDGEGSGSEDGHDDHGSTASSDEETETGSEDGYAYAQVEPDRRPRQHGDEFINDYGDDVYGELDLQADVYEAMFDVKEEVSAEQSRSLLLPPAAAARKAAAAAAAAAARRRPNNRLFRNLFAKLFGKDVAGDAAEVDDAAAPRGYAGLGLASEDLLRQVEGAGRPKRSRLRVWFAVERKVGSGGARRAEAREPPPDVSGTAMRFNQAEENAASRQQLGKALFAQGKYDAALALFSLSVKIREDNGLRNAKSTAVAHTDVASAFIHLGDLRNADKHLETALGVFAKKTFSGGNQELGDVHCFRAVVAEMRGELSGAEKEYRRAIALYEKSGATRSNPNYETAKENLRDNLRRQKEGPPEAKLQQQYQEHQQQLAAKGGDAVSPVSTVDSEAGKENSSAAMLQQQPPAHHRPAPRNAIKSILRQGAGIKPRIAAPPPQTLSTINSFPDTMESAAYAGHAPATNSSSRMSNSQMLDPASLASAPVHHKSPSSIQLPPTLDEYRRTAEQEAVAADGDAAGSRRSRRRSSRPTTWRALADVARASMPFAPIEDSEVGSDPIDDDPTIGSYEEMSRGWQRDGRKLLVAGSYVEAIDMYTLAIYTRKRHGPWATKANAETHVEYARALFATKDVLGAAKTLRDAIVILEKMDRRTSDMMLGQVWGNLGSALDRLGDRERDAETAHSTGLVLFARAGLAKDDPRWTKAWRNLCVCVKAQGANGRPIESVWQNIDLQIRGVHPVTNSATIKI